MTNRKSGFTLMEIMVVIIVIAVLASVAGPMIGSITDQGRASATKSKLSSLKSGLLSYKNDVGRFPFYGTTAVNERKIAAYCAETILSYDDDAKNVLVSDGNIILGGTTASPVVKNYGRRWKGPYMDANPEDFMYDSWGNKILYTAQGKNLYVWSYGANGEAFCEDNLAHTFKEQSNADSDCDDIVVSIAKFRNDFN